MTTRSESFLELASASPGSVRRLKVVGYGKDDARPKAYLQAALHADEAPGVLVLHYLQKLLDEADAASRVTGRIVVVPVANPIGMAQRVQGNPIGRLSFESGNNFNRHHADLTDEAARRIVDQLDGDQHGNQERIRTALCEAAKAIPVTDEESDLRRQLLTLAIDADICLDLHCDTEAVMHMYTAERSWPRESEIAAQLGCRVVFLADVSGGHPFDEAVSGPWADLARRFPEYEIPAAPIAATIELRGVRDVDDETAAKDAANLFACLQRQGVIEGCPPAMPEALCEATPLSGLERLRAPCSGIVTYLKNPGQRVSRGDVVARVLNPYSAIGDGVMQVCAGTDGLLFSRCNHRIVACGQVVAGIAGKYELPQNVGAHLLSD